MTAQPQYTPDQIAQAVQNAFSAGRYEEARQLDELYANAVEAQQLQQQPQPQPQQVQPQQPQPQEVPEHLRDSAFSYGIDQAQKLFGSGIEGIGKFVGSEGMQEYGRDVQTKQDYDIAKGGYQQKYNSFEDAFKKDGWSGALTHAGQATASGIPTSGATLIGGGATALAAYAGAPVWFVALLGGGTTALGVNQSIGENVQEQREKNGDDFNANVSVGIGIVNGILDRLGVKKIFKPDDLMKMSPNEIAEVLRNKGMGEKAKQFLKDMGVEASVETAQDITNMASVSALGGEYTGDEVRQRLTDSFLTGGLVSASIKGGTDTIIAGANLVRGGNSDKSQITSEEEMAAQAYAQRLIKKADANGYDLKDVSIGSTKGARSAVDGTHIDMANRLAQKFKDLKEVLQIKDTDSLELVAKKVQAKTAHQKGKNKTKNIVEQEDFQAVRELAGNTREGQEIINLLHEMNQMTDVHNKGYKGGVSSVTDQFLPVGTSGEGYNVARTTAEYALRPLFSLQAGLSTGGASIPMQLGVVGAGRAIDKLTGRRSRVQQYVKTYGKGQGQPTPTAPSVREARQEELARQEAEEVRLQEQQAQRAEEDRQANLQRVAQGAPPQLGSPENIVQDGTGLDRAGIAKVLRAIKANPNTLPAVRRAIEAYERGIAVGGEMDFALIRDINSFVNNNPDYVQRVREPNAQALANGQAQRQTQRDINYERGVEANRQFAQQLMDAVTADKSIPPVQKAKLLAILDEMRLNLGSNPVAKLESQAKRLQDEGVDPQVIQKYFVPYAERVMQQQQAAQEKAQLDADDSRTIDVDSLVSNPNARNQIMTPDDERVFVSERMARAEEQGFDTSNIMYHATKQDFDRFVAGYADGLIFLTPSSEFANRWLGKGKFGEKRVGKDSGYDSLQKRRDQIGEEYKTASEAQREVLYEERSQLFRDMQEADKTIYPVLVKTKNPFVPHKDFAVMEELVGREKMDEGFSPADGLPTYRDAYKDGVYLLYETKPVIDFLKSKGYDSVFLSENRGEGTDYSTFAVFDPKDIRSLYAQFDPSKVDSSMISDQRVPALTQVSSPNIIPIRDGSETPPKMTGKTAVGNYLQDRAREKLGGRVRDLNSPEDRSAIADDMVDEAVYEMENTDSAIEWYDTTVQRMLEMLSLKYPEIASDEDAQTAMFMSLAITSQNLSVPLNLRKAEQAYKHFRNKGKFRIYGTGKAAKSMKANFKKANMLIDQLDSVAEVRDFLQTEFSVKELNATMQDALGIDYEVGGENVDTIVYGSALFGPKVGNGFYSNLRGEFSPVTMDMWFMRTVGRLRGKLMAFDETKLDNQLAKLKSALGRKRMSKAKLIEKARELKKAHEKDFKVNRALYDNKTKVKSEATNAAINVVKSLTDTVDVPSGGGERNNLRLLVQEAVQKFNERTGLDLTPAAFQALIWYPEQELYSQLGVKLKDIRQDYASATKQLLLKEGFNEQEIEAADSRVRVGREQGTGQVRQESAADVRTRSRAGSQPAGVPLQEQESPSPILTVDESSQLPLAFPMPEVSEVKDNIEPASAIVEGVINIGKKGTLFEDGIANLSEAITTAGLLNVSIEFLDGAVEMMARTGAEPTTYGQHQAITGAESQIFVRTDQGSLSTLMTTIHEMGHAIEFRPVLPEGVTTAVTENRLSAHPKAETGFKPQFRNSLRNKLSRILFTTRTDKIGPETKFLKDPDGNTYPMDRKLLTMKQAKAMRKEMDKIQTMNVGPARAKELGTEPLRETVDSTVATIVRRQKGREGTQEEKDLFMSLNKDAVKKAFRDYQKYTKNDAEFAVDPLIFYMVDPKGFKKVAPLTAEFIRNHFKGTPNLPIKFHAHPLAVVMAIIMAGLAKMGGEEEEEMSAGALTPQPAILSA